VDDLVVDNELAATVVDDENTDGATARVEAVANAVDEAALVKDGDALLDITTLGHGNDTAVVTDVEDTVLLEDRAEHVLDDNGWGWVGDEAALLVQLLGEQVDTEVTVLAGLGRGGDADDLARAALEDQEIANADVVAGDGDGVEGRHLAGWYSWTSWATVGVGDGRGDAFFTWSRDGDLLVLDDDFFAGGRRRVVLVVVVVVAERRAVDGVSDAFSYSLDTTTERMVVTVVVVIAHITLVLWGVDSRSRSGALYSNLFWLRAGELSCVATEARAGVFVVITGGGTSDRDGVLAELTFSGVEGLLKGWSLTTNDTTFTIVDAFLGVGVVLYVELSVGVAGERFRVAVGAAMLD
jgi:hypothetical protein